MTSKAAHGRDLPLFLAFLVSLITLAVYLPVLGNGFVGWDDDVYIVENLRIRTLGAEFFRWAFADLSAGFWHPVTWVSLALDHALWGLNPVGYHLTAVLLHVANTFLVVVLVIRLLSAAHFRNPAESDPGSVRRTVLTAGVITGLLFGLHPLHVESVAWISERKDLLCALFFLLSAVAYIGYAEKRGAESDAGAEKAERWYLDRGYILSFLFFVLALASKTMAVSLPLVFLLVDWYPLRRMRSSQGIVRLILEKAPFVACSVAIAVVSVIAQKGLGAFTFMESVSLPVRVLVAFRALVKYLWKMVVPMDLLPFYPYPADVRLFSVEYLVAVLLVAGITVLGVMQVKRYPFLLAVWGYYVITLGPVLGIVQIGSFSMADRFTYLPSVGPFLLAGVGVAVVQERAGEGVMARRVVAGMLACVVIVLSYLTVKQTGIWKDSLSLWSYQIKKEPGRVPVAYNNLGLAFKEKGEFDRAMENFSIAIELSPKYHLPYNNRGLVYKEQGLLDQALEDYSRAIALDPGYAKTYYNRGIVYGEAGQFDRAIKDFTMAVQLDPFLADAYTARGLTFQEDSQPERALADYDIAARLNPLSPDVYLNRGVTYERLGQLDRAVADYSRAIELNRNDTLAYLNRGKAYQKQGITELAERDFRRACELGNRSGCIALKSSR